MFVIDTNILVYAADEHSSGHEPCRKLLSEARVQQESWYLTWGIIYEFLRVSTHPRLFSKPLSIRRAWAFLDAVVASPTADILQETRRHQESFDGVAKEVPGIAGNFVFDVHTAVLMREHGIRRIYTHDMDFQRFPFLEVIDPVE